MLVNTATPSRFLHPPASETISSADIDLSLALFPETKKSPSSHPPSISDFLPHPWLAAKSSTAVAIIDIPAFLPLQCHTQPLLPFSVSDTAQHHCSSPSLVSLTSCVLLWHRSQSLTLPSTVAAHSPCSGFSLLVDVASCLLRRPYLQKSSGWKFS